MSPEQDKSGNGAGRRRAAAGSASREGAAKRGTGNPPQTSGKTGQRPAGKQSGAKQSGAKQTGAKQTGARKAGARARGARSARRPRSILRRLGGWAWRAGVVVLMIPIIAVPVYILVPPVSTLMIWQTVREGPVDRRWVPLEEIAPSLVNSVLMSEDGRYCAHDGVDWEELTAVLETSTGRRRGASTISMQAVKNVFLWQSRSVVRKALEIPLAIFADTIWGKRRMMEIYLNVVEWGPGVFGAEAAALHHFGRSARDLTASQSALLAVTLPNPAVRDPARPSGRMKTLADAVAGRARASGAYINCLS